MDCFAQVNNIKLHYLDHPGDGPTLILLPGLTANAHSFDGLIQAGLSPRFRVLALDLRGRGLSDKPATGYSMDEHAQDVIALMDSLDIHQAVICGHSFGGLLTMFIAGHYPERVTKIVMIDAAALMVNPMTRDLIKPSLDRLGRIMPSWEDYLDQMKRAPFFDGWWDPTIENYYRADVEFNDDGTVQARSKPENIAEAIDRAGAKNWTAHIAAIRQPALLLHAPGGYGPAGTPPIVLLEQAQATAAAMADCIYIEVPGNHMTMLFGNGARTIVENITGFVTP